MTTMDLVTKICSFSPRLGENEIKTANYITELLSSQNIPFVIQNFPNQIPLTQSTSLKIDDQDIQCLGSCFTSGQITSIDQIKFDTHSDYLSTHSCTKKPSLYISRKDAHLLTENAKIDGEVVVEKYSYNSQNILVGNINNPKNIIFAHYDCLGGGAVDNAGSVSVLLELCTSRPALRTNNLFIFAGNEELSYDHPNYWGKGYRQFEYKYPTLLENCQKIIVIDGIGLTSPVEIIEDQDNFFPIDKLNRYHKKTKIISSLQSEVLKCYHSAEDTSDKLNSQFLDESRSLLLTKMLS